NERGPVARLVDKRAFEHGGDIARHYRRAGAFGGELAVLRVQRADACTLGVVQNGRADCAWDMVVGKLRRTAHVDSFRVFGKPLDADPIVAQRNAHFAFTSNGSSWGQTLSRSFGWASTVGCTRSA